MIEKLKALAESLKVTAGQLSLAWLLAQGDCVFPIPGTKREKYLTENNNSAYLKLTPE